MKRMLTSVKLIAVGVVLLSLGDISRAQEQYQIGLSGVLTGGGSGANAPTVETMRIYFNRLNAAGGINGRKVNLVIRDDQGEASKGAANARRLLTEDKVVMLINVSQSSTYGAMMAEAEREGTPLLFAAVCPKEVFPPAKKLFFCSTAYASNYDSRAGLAFIRGETETHAGKVKIGFNALAVPVSRAEIDFAEQHSKTLDMIPVDKEILPLATADFLPFATKLKISEPDWVWAWSSWVFEKQILESMRRLGWTGKYLAWAHIEAEDSIEQIKDPNLFVIGGNAFFGENLSIHQEIIAAAKSGSFAYPVTQMAEGWVAAMTIEAALRAVGWPINGEKLQTAMSNLKVDTKGIRGRPIEWTADNHFRKEQSYRVYRWNAGKTEMVKDWQVFEVK